MTTIVSAVFLGIAVLLAGSLPWGALLAPLNLRVLPSVPWAIVPMALYLYAYWTFIGGRVGAGDSASAGIVTACIAGADARQAAAFGNLVASITVQQIGRTGTATPDQVRARHAECGH